MWAMQQNTTLDRFMKRGADGAISLDVTSQIRVRSGKPRRALVLKGLKGLKDRLSWDSQRSQLKGYVFSPVNWWYHTWFSMKRILAMNRGFRDIAPVVIWSYHTTLLLTWRLDPSLSLHDYLTRRDANFWYHSIIEFGLAYGCWRWCWGRSSWVLGILLKASLAKIKSNIIKQYLTHTHALEIGDLFYMDSSP